MRRALNRPIALMLVSAFCGLAASGAAIAGQATLPATPAMVTPTTVTPAAPAAQGTGAAATSGTPAPATATVPAGSAATASAAEPAQQAAEAKVTCRTVKTTGSRLQTRKVCSTPDSEKGSADWVRDQQARGAIGASAILNGQ